MLCGRGMFRVGGCFAEKECFVADGCFGYNDNNRLGIFSSANLLFSHQPLVGCNPLDFVGVGSQEEKYFHVT